MGPKAYRVFSVLSVVACAVLYFLFKVVYDGDVPAWLHVVIVVTLVVLFVIEIPYQRRKSRREGRL